MTGISTQLKGQIAQLRVEQRAAELGFSVSRPTTDCRYDLIVDDNQKLIRIQIKYCNGKTKSNGCYTVNLRRWAGDKRKITRNYHSHEIDYIAAYIPDIDDICLIPPTIFHNKTCLHIRISSARNNQSIGIVMFHDYVWRRSVAQPGERRIWDAKVAGAEPVTPTIL